MRQNKLGIFVREPSVGAVKTRLVPPLSPGDAHKLYLAFLHDVAVRLGASRMRPTVFVAGDPRTVAPIFPGWPVAPQSDGSLGERLDAAFATLLQAPHTRAVIVGSDSPDLPLAHIKRAFRLLKHRDVVLGPAMDGGYYLIGLRAPASDLFRGIAWGSDGVLRATVHNTRRAGLSLALTPPWYDVDDAASLSFLRAMCDARRTIGGETLPHTRAFLDSLGD